MDDHSVRDGIRDGVQFAQWEDLLPTLRDQIAIAALNGMLTHSDAGRWEDFATQAYRFADVMLAARAPKPEPQTTPTMSPAALRELASSLADIHDRVTELATMDDRELRERNVELTIGAVGELRKGVEFFLERTKQ